MVDFADIGIGTWRFYIFNIADSAVTVAIMLMFALWFVAPYLGIHMPGETRTARRETMRDGAGSQRAGSRMRRLTITVPETAEGRVDRFVADVSGLSRSYVQKLITEGHVTAAGSPIKANEPIVAGEIVELEIPDPRPLELAAGADTALRRLRGRRPADRRQGGRAGRPSRAGPSGRDAGQRARSPATPSTAASPASSGRASSIASTATRAAC